LKNEAGDEIKEATPGMAVEIDGWREQPAAGSEVLEAPNEQKAKDIIDYRLEKSETQKLSQDMAAINETRRETLEKRRREASEEESLPADDEPTGPKPIHFIVKADVSGSVEAVMNSVSAIGNNEVYANVLRSGVGTITEFDIQHAQTANGHIVSFNVPVDPAMSRMAELNGVKILDYKIIYELIDAVKAELSEHLPPSVSRRVTGEAEISQIFDITIKGRETTAIAGCKVRNGTINRNKKVRVLRGEEIVYDGKLRFSLFTI
jgi:translation initiation factor IF-2